MKKPLIVLAVATVLLLLMMVSQRSARTERTAVRPALPGLDTAAVSEIVLRKGTDSLRITRGPQGWSVFPGDWPAKPERVSRFFQEVSSLTLGELISSSLERAAIYGLDSANKSHMQITQKTSDGKNTTYNIEIGKTDQSFTGTFLRETDSPKVFKSSGGFWVDLGERSWKNTAFWEYWADSALAVNVVWTDSAGAEHLLDAQRGDSARWYATGDTTALAAGSAEEVLQRLRGLEIDLWYNEKPADLKPLTLRARITLPGNRLLEADAAGEHEGAVVFAHPGTGRWVGVRDWRLSGLRTALGAFVN